MNNFAYFDENSKKEIRRATLKAVAIPGYQVPFGSREMPIARGWGTGGLQITLSLIGPDDVLKVIDQGSDDSVNAVSIKHFIQKTSGINTTTHTSEATIIQSRHRIPEKELNASQILVLQVPMPEPLRMYEASESKTKKLHAEKDYTGAWLMLFEQITQMGTMTTGSDHPVYVHQRYVMAPSPIPKYDNPKLYNREALILFGAGREKKIYALPPYTRATSLDFLDHPFEIESMHEKQCMHCHSSHVFMDELFNEDTNQVYYQCNDTDYCQKMRLINHG